MEKGKGGYSVVATAQHRLMQKMMMDSSPGISRDKEHHQSNHTNIEQNMDLDNYNNNQYPHNYNDNNNLWDRRLQALATTHTKPSHQILPPRGGGLHHHPHPDGQSSLSRSSLRSSSLKSKSSSLKSARMSSISGRFDRHFLLLHPVVHILLYTSCCTHPVVTYSCVINSGFADNSFYYCNLLLHLVNILRQYTLSPLLTNHMISTHPNNTNTLLTRLIKPSPHTPHPSHRINTSYPTHSPYPPTHPNRNIVKEIP